MVVATVRIELPDLVTVGGANVPVVFARKPLTLNVATPVKPFTVDQAEQFLQAVRKFIAH